MVLLLPIVAASTRYRSPKSSREIVLGRLAALIKKFVAKVGLAQGLSEAAATAAGGKIFTFGSYRLGAHGPGTDIDTLCVVPKHVTREAFFELLEPMLKETEGVTEVSVSTRHEIPATCHSMHVRQGVPDAYVPVIKTKISGIPIDLTMARLALSSIPDDLTLQDDNILRNLDDRCVRSLNGAPHISLHLATMVLTRIQGSRVTDEILRLVPNVDVFRDALRCIKLWAKRKYLKHRCPCSYHIPS